MAKHTEHSILGVIENMSYFESKETGNKEYVFGKGGGRKLADELNTQLLGELPLEQPTWNPKDFSPSIYQADDRLGEIYTSIAQKVIASTIKNKDRFSVKLRFYINWTDDKIHQSNFHVLNRKRRNYLYNY